MAGNIQLTPAELISQAGQMRALYEQYTSFFNNVESILMKINDSWSPNLASNFLSKISSVENGSKTVLSLIENGINIAEASAQSFESVDECLAKLMKDFMDSQNGAILGTPPSSAPNISNLVDVATSVGGFGDILPDDYARIVESIAGGDFSSAINELMPGFTGEMKDKVIDIVKDKTGLTVDPDKFIESVKNGDYSGALLDVAEASNDIATSTGGLSPEGIAIDFLLNAARSSTDENGFAMQDADIYSNRILDAASEGDWVGVLSNVGDYTMDVGIRNVCSAAGDTISNTVDTVTKNTIGISVSEINDKIEDWSGFNPGKAFNDTLGKIGDKWHKFVSGNDEPGIANGLLLNLGKSSSDFLSGIGDGITKMF